MKGPLLLLAVSRATPVRELTGDEYEHRLPPCVCENFVNGLKSSNVGQDACARRAVNGLFGSQLWCQLTDRPYLPG